MRRLVNVRAWVVLAALAVGSLIVWYYATHADDEGFRVSFLAELGGTIVGAAIGIPIALWANEASRKEEERIAAADQAKEAHERKTAVLQMIRTELAWKPRAHPNLWSQSESRRLHTLRHP